MKDGSLNSKQAMFVREYLVDLNATQAAVRAGYSAKTAAMQGSRLLTNDEVSRAILEAQGERAEKVGVTAEEVLLGIRALVRRCELPGVEFNASAGLKGYELMGKHIAMWTDRQEHAGQVTVTFAGANADL